jgi:hypothetical protein
MKKIGMICCIIICSVIKVSAFMPKPIGWIRVFDSAGKRYEVRYSCGNYQPMEIREIRELMTPLPPYIGFQLRKETIAHLPYTNTNDIASISTVFYQTRRGAPLIPLGGRPEEVLYVIDGIQVMRY